MIAITGASGYVGAHCVAEALKRNLRVIAISTQPANNALRSHGERLTWQYVGHRYASLDHREWVARLGNVETIIHCAARVHQTSADAQREMYRDNTVLTETIAQAAAEAGVKRFVFLSSAAVYGRETTESAILVSDPLYRGTSYAISKIEAEQKLTGVQGKTYFDLHILRPPVVYGRGAPGNVSRLARWVAKGMPLPLGAIDNRRSIVSIRSLTNAIFWCVERPLSKEISMWNPTDRASISTTQMVNAIARGAKLRARNLAVPPSLLRAALNVTGRQRMASQLLDTWELDASALFNAGFDGAMDSEIELVKLGRSFLHPDT